MGEPLGTPAASPEAVSRLWPREGDRGAQMMPHVEGMDLGFKGAGVVERQDPG